MKYRNSHKTLIGLLIALLIAVSAASAQNSTVTFDLTTLQHSSSSSTITDSDTQTQFTASSGAGRSYITVESTGLTAWEANPDDSIKFSFSKDVILQSFRVGGLVSLDLNGNESWLFKLSGSEYTENIPANITTGNTYTFTNKLNISAGTELELVFKNPSGYDFPTDRIVLDQLTVTTTVPEPSTYALFLGFGAFVFIMIRHRRRD